MSTIYESLQPEKLILKRSKRKKGTTSVHPSVLLKRLKQHSEVLLVFSVTPFKIDQNKKSKPFHRLSPESGNRKKVDMQRLSPRFRSEQFFLWKICGETSSPNLQRFVWRRHVGAHLDGHQHGGRKSAETSVTEFCYKGVNLSLEELKNVTMILYSNTRTVQITEFPEICHLLNQHHSSLARHVNATSRKSLEIQAQSITKPKTHSE